MFYLRKKGVILLLVVTFLFGVTTGLGASNKVEIEAIIDYGIKMKLNGNDFSPIDSNGKTLAPITYNGSTYLPVRAIAEAVNMPVNWDGTTRTIYLGETEVSKSLLDFKYDAKYGISASKNIELLGINNNLFDYGFYSTKDLGRYLLPPEISVNLDNEYQNLYFTVGMVGSGTAKIVIIDDPYGSKITLESLTISESDGLVNVEVPLKGSKHFKIEVNDNGFDKLVIGEPYLK